MKSTITLVLCTFCSIAFAQIINKKEVGAVLDAWHKAATNAQEKNYFDLMSDDAVFLGTDASERWTKEQFRSFAKPFFDKGKAWAFTPTIRHIDYDGTQTIAWFDELLDTWMGVCRGSGVLRKQPDGTWLIVQYNLAVAVPNDKMDGYLKVLKGE